MKTLDKIIQASITYLEATDQQGKAKAFMQFAEAMDQPDVEQTLINLDKAQRAVLASTRTRVSSGLQGVARRAAARLELAEDQQQQMPFDDDQQQDADLDDLQEIDIEAGDQEDQQQE
jgi:hypothetical protein